ncbi:hypothetical protein ACLB2K_032734 [Fragaria x ananassa]
MLGGLYGDLPPPSSADEDNKPTNSTVWSSSTKMAPQTLRKPSSIFAAPQTILKSQPKPKPTAAKIAASPVQTALVGVTSTVLEEYDPARPNDYEEYRRERKKKAMEAEVRRELDRRRMEEEEKERREREERERERERERDRDRERDDSRLNISGEEAWRRRAAMSGSKVAVSAEQCGWFYDWEVGEWRTGGRSWRADDCGAENDGENGVEAGAGDYYSFDG